MANPLLYVVTSKTFTRVNAAGRVCPWDASSVHLSGQDPELGFQYKSFDRASEFCEALNDYRRDLLLKGLVAFLEYEPTEEGQP